MSKEKKNKAQIQICDEMIEVEDLIALGLEGDEASVGRVEGIGDDWIVIYDYDQGRRVVDLVRIKAVRVAGVLVQDEPNLYDFRAAWEAGVDVRRGS